MSQQVRHSVSATPTLDTNAYAAGDRLGSLMTISHGNAEGKPITLQTLTVLDKADQGTAFDVLFFDAQPTIASNDNAALDISDAEMDKCIGIVSVAGADFADCGGARVASVRSVGLALKPAAGATAIYALLVARGTPTYTASSLRLSFHFDMDRT